jgi:hypothetical protein
MSLMEILRMSEVHTGGNHQVHPGIDFIYDFRELYRSVFLNQ